MAPTSHASGQGWGSRRSVSNYMYNHIGHFASAGEAMCKALFFGGVTHRFPELNFAFLECGVAWACSLYSDILEHWEKRNRDAIAALDPESTDLDLMMELVAEYAGIDGEGKLEEVRASLARKQRRPRKPRRLVSVRHREGRGHPRPLRAAFLLRLRGRRSHDRVGVQ